MATEDKGNKPEDVDAMAYILFFFNLFFLLVGG